MTTKKKTYELDKSISYPNNLFDEIIEKENSIVINFGDYERSSYISWIYKWYKDDELKVKYPRIFEILFNDYSKENPECLFYSLIVFNMKIFRTCLQNIEIDPYNGQTIFEIIKKEKFSKKQLFTIAKILDKYSNNNDLMKLLSSLIYFKINKFLYFKRKNFLNKNIVKHIYNKKHNERYLKKLIKYYPQLNDPCFHSGIKYINTIHAIKKIIEKIFYGYRHSFIINVTIYCYDNNNVKILKKMLKHFEDIILDYIKIYPSSYISEKCSCIYKDLYQLSKKFSNVIIQKSKKEIKKVKSKTINNKNIKKIINKYINKY